MSREDWLMNGMQAMRVLISRAGAEFPDNVRVSCGWPRKSTTAIGQSADEKTCTENRWRNLFIAPSIAEPVLVLGTLLHEMAHATVGHECGHGGAFRELCVKLGLGTGEAGEDGEPTGRRMTHANAVPGTRLHKELSEIAEMLGPYPHTAMNGGADRISRAKTRHVSVYSVNEPDYRVLIRVGDLRGGGFPRDPWGDPMVLKEDLPEAG